MAKRAKARSRIAELLATEESRFIVNRAVRFASLCLRLTDYFSVVTISNADD